eukprot:405314-Heterocapsa_arctica.AAC.1
MLVLLMRRICPVWGYLCHEYIRPVTSAPSIMRISLVVLWLLPCANLALSSRIWGVFHGVA